MAFFTYHQNNSFGTFTESDRVSEYVIIEANNAKLADNKAKEIGIYFNGVQKEIDCPCCGDRWHCATDYTAKEEPTIYGKTGDSLNEYKVIIYFKDGSKKHIKNS
jgi:hypothetical protein